MIYIYKYIYIYTAYIYIISNMFSTLPTRRGSSSFGVKQEMAGRLAAAAVQRVASIFAA
jgi:hypothetical protein